MASHVYAQFFSQLAAKTINLNSDALKWALTTSTYVPNQGSDTFWSTPQANEVSGTGYTAGGIAASGVTITNSGGVFTFTTATADFGVLTVSNIRILVLYDSTPGTAGTDPLIWYWDIGANQNPAGVDFQVQFPSNVFTITPS